MSKTSLLFLTAVFLVFFASLFIVLKTPQGWPNGLPWGGPSPTATAFASQENSGGEIDVKVTPLVLKAGEKPQFEIEFNTHSVELDFDVAKVAELSNRSEKINKESIWEGSPPGGHHRSGILTFTTPLTQTKSVNLTIRDISGVSKREFIWQL